MIYAGAILVTLFVFAFGIAVERSKWRELVVWIIAAELKRHVEHSPVIYRALFPLLIQARTERTVNVARNVSLTNDSRGSGDA